MTRKIKVRENTAINLFMRNPLHDHPMLGKGGVHKKTNKAIRRKEKIAVKKEWLPQNIFSIVFFDEAFLNIIPIRISI
jgi:hypothetical protein